MNIEEKVKRNKKFLEEFKSWLKNKGLAEKTINSHVDNAELYIDDYLVYYEGATAEEGVGLVFMFLNDWFIRKCMWSSASSIKSTASSIKKFYQFMCENGYVEKSDYNKLCNEIKENMDTFIDSLNEYENEDYEDFEDDDLF